MQGRIITAHGRHFTVKSDNGSIRHSYTKGKKSGVCVGDYVRLALLGNEEARIEEVLERKNLLYRSDDMRSKQFAANVDQLCIVVAVQPTFSDDLISRAIVGARSAGISPIILLNKIDLVDAYPEAKARLSLYERLDIPVTEISTRTPETLRKQLFPLLYGKTNLLLGQSAMGKSSILNVLVPEANAHTQEYSTALGTGKHTTTTTSLYELADIHASLIDSPGFQSFGLRHLGQSDVILGFPEFSAYVAQCKFYNCTHLHEPGCGVLHALKAGYIHPKRHAIYERILLECTASEKY